MTIVDTIFKQRKASLLCAALAISVLVPGKNAQAAPSPDSAESRLERLAHPKTGDIIVIAHRACWKKTAENSLAAIRACLAMGADGVEFDVRHSKDGVAVIMHDPTVDRMTTGHGRVDELTLAELKHLRLRSGAGGPGASITSETIPTLKEYLTTAKGKLWLVFDVKDHTQEESFEIAKAVGVESQAIFFYECRNDDLLNHIKSFWDRSVIFPISFEKDGKLSKSISSCRSNPENLIHTKWSNPGFLEEAGQDIQTRNERVWIATMFPEDVAGLNDDVALKNPDKVWGEMIKHGANMIMTNEPKALLDFLRHDPQNKR
jgi:glycerophosphoryl diester phosphodiesterase